MDKEIVTYKWARKLVSHNQKIIFLKAVTAELIMSFLSETRVGSSIKLLGVDGWLYKMSHFDTGDSPSYLLSTIIVSFF